MQNIDYKEIERVCGKIPPLWPLENYVAVNPFLGFSDRTFEETAGIYEKTASAKLTLPVSFYLAEYDNGNITDEDLKKALSKNNFGFENNISGFISSAKNLNNESGELDKRVMLIMDIASNTSDQNWGSFVADRITNWASSYFDKGQALWKTGDKSANIYQSWKSEALIDRTPKISGVSAFQSTIIALPEDEKETILHCIDALDIDQASLDPYIFALLVKVGGWASYCAGLDWDNRLYGGQTNYTTSFLAILLSWELAIYNSNPKAHSYWKNFKKDLIDVENNNFWSANVKHQLIFQNAYDIACQRSFVDKFNTGTKSDQSNERPLAQAVFCIDVRSEVYRRNLEMISPEVQTKGFAGFFGFPIQYQPLAHEFGEMQCPVLIPAGPTAKEYFGSEDTGATVEKRRKIGQQYTKAWKAFKSGAVTGFSFVSALGLSYIPKLISDSFGWTRPAANPNEIGMTQEELLMRSVKLDMTIDEQVQMAKGALNAMSFTSNFAKFVLITGHGASTVNNPHTTGLDCGACGGRSGEANAKVAALILNNPEVRTALSNEGIIIPEDTVFLACLHDTTTDNLTIYNESVVPSSHLKELNTLKSWLQKAGQATRTERAARFHIQKGNKSEKVLNRSKDWAQVRPEWGLAGCNAFVVAPRFRTKNIDLGGKSFLHDYTWQEDEGFGVLNAIMTAPMVVTSWINLQYYASAVDNKIFGAGNKTLHNVVGGFGVIEGQGGDLRVGLPIQSVFDGENFQHLPQRLNVVIEAPIDAMNEVLKNNPQVNHLCSNGWIKLMAMDENGKVSQEYSGNLEWVALNARVESEAL
jgi:hypothetical protein